MTLHLTKSQLQAIEQEISQCLKYPPEDMTDKLLIAIITKFYKRIVVKLLDLKKKYTLQFDDETALAFYLYFNDQLLQATSFNDLTIKIICNTINKQYA